MNWTSVKSQMPKSQQRVLVCIHTRYGNDVVTIAAHINEHEVTTEEYGWQEFEGDTPYDEENDCYWIPECWYEENFVEDNANWIIDSVDGIVTHWMALPETPKEG